MSKNENDGEYRIMVRFPGTVGFGLREMAERNHRSINNEIVFRVERSIAAEKTAPEPTA